MNDTGGTRSASASTTSDADKSDSARPTYVVGVGASAGGLEALERMLDPLPQEGTGLAFVIVQHLSPDHKSMMVDLLTKRTAMAVLEARDGLRVEPDNIYILPAGKTMTIGEGRLWLTAKDRRDGIVLPVDIFLNSLADDRGAVAVAVILSGTGSDGTAGVRRIHEQGGRAAWWWCRPRAPRNSTACRGRPSTPAWWTRWRSPRRSSSA